MRKLIKDILFIHFIYLLLCLFATVICLTVGYNIGVYLFKAFGVAYITIIVLIGIGYLVQLYFDKNQ